MTTYKGWRNDNFSVPNNIYLGDGGKAISDTQKGVANGVATLDEKGLLTSTQIPQVILDTLIPQELLDTLCAGKPFYTGSGIDQYIYVPDNTEMEMELGDFSYQTIICLPDYTPSTPVTIARHANGADFLGWIFTIGTDGKLNLAIGNGSNFITYSYTSTLAVRHADGRIAEVGFCADRDGYVEFFDFFGSLGKVDMSNSVAQTVTATNPANLVFFQNIDGTIEYNFMGLWKVEYWNFALTCAKWMEYAKSGNPHKYQGANKTISHWTEVAPQLNSQTDIRSLAVFNGKLYGGTYPNGCLFEWNGVDSWKQVAPQLNSQTYIHSLAVFNGKLYGGTGSNGCLFEWNGVDSWIQVAPQLNSQRDIRSLAVFNGKLYGGTYPNGCLFEWNGVDSWKQVAPQLNSQTDIYSLAVFNGKLYGGTYPNGCLFEWNGVDS